MNLRRIKAIKKHRTTVNIDNDEAPNNDLAFLQANKLKPTNLLRSKIKELRGGINYREANLKLLRLREKILEKVKEEIGEEKTIALLSSIRI